MTVSEIMSKETTEARHLQGKLKDGGSREGGEEWIKWGGVREERMQKWRGGWGLLLALDQR